MLSWRLILWAVALSAAAVGGWAVCQWRADAKIAALRLEWSQATAAALKAERSRTTTAIIAANKANRALSEAEANLLDAREARDRAQKELIHAFDADPDLDRPGLPERVWRDILQHWADQ
ncbi:hypothetical protein DL1_18185 [Thioclava dalianensis]|uniref:Uncharacterized protein n=1 Tax=Thioclava dalianensis TaxID=1185766 RepID=A0A074TCN5_9RHOB|nr:hypothetical protein [Thioclava dalianensis]KEP67910.1 hypothetical protein DL1_18185 [Thioclava dalianensis]